MKRLLISAILLAFASVIKAQKLPNIQKESVFAPQQLTIDGKFREWGTSLQAHNSATEISYTLANDDNNLYLVIQSTDQDATNKICRGGVTLLIQKSGKKEDKNGVAITYPISDLTGNFQIRPLRNVRPDTSAQALTAIMEKYNKQLDQHIKYIGIKGIVGIDTLISIYNENSIKAAGRFDINKVYTLELSLPLKYLGFSVGGQEKFAYHIILNGYKKTPTFGQPTNMDGTPATSESAQKLMAAMAQMDAAMSARVDFWGEYTLAKK